MKKQIQWTVTILAMIISTDLIAYENKYFEIIVTKKAPSVSFVKHVGGDWFVDNRKYQKNISLMLNKLDEYKLNLGSCKKNLNSGYSLEFVVGGITIAFLTGASLGLIYKAVK